MKKKVIRKKQITPDQAKQMKAQADERFSPGVGERLSSMVAAAIQRKIRVRYLSVTPSSLLPHVPEALERAKAFLVGEQARFDKPDEFINPNGRGEHEPAVQGDPESNHKPVERAKRIQFEIAGGGSQQVDDRIRKDIGERGGHHDRND